MIDYDPLEEFRDPVTYDAQCDHVDEELPLIEREAARVGGTLLDVACGTGRTALRLAARGYFVTGVDVVPEMVARGREKAAEQGTAVEWVVGDARTFALGMRFGCAYMVGNAFQMFYTRADYEGMLGSVREHLQPGGCFVFDTRNPSPGNLREAHDNSLRRYTLPDGTWFTSTSEAPRYDPLAQIQHLTSHHTWTHPNGERVEQVKRIALRYVYPRELETLLHYNGFTLRALYGSWQCEPLTADSREMVVVCEPHL